MRLLWRSSAFSRYRWRPKYSTLNLGLTLAAALLVVVLMWVVVDRALDNAVEKADETVECRNVCGVGAEECE